MKLLVVAMPESVHTARWLAQLEGRGWSIDLFSSNATGFSHSDIREATVHHLFRSRQPGVRQRGIPLGFRKVALAAELAADRLAPWVRRDALVRLIRRVRPDVVHSLEFQHSAYLTLRAREAFGDGFPPWIVTNWGSDIYHFARDPAHAQTIQRVLATADAYSCECRRDAALAAQMGFRGITFPPAPNAGGFDLERARALRSGLPSTRRLIMVKGYQHWAGRALVALRAVEACADALRGFAICVYSATRDVAEKAHALARRTRLEIEVLPAGVGVPHDELLRRHGAARISVGLSITDGISTSFLEALLMGSFPIQSWTSCANEWIVDGETGLLVPPEDPDTLSEAIRRALGDDRLVDQAAERNWRTAQERLDAGQLALSAAGMYEQVVRVRHGDPLRSSEGNAKPAGGV